MAKRERAVKGDIIDPTDEAPDPDLGLAAAMGDDTDVEAIQLLLRDQELDGGKVRIERKGPGDAKHLYCTSMAPADFDRDNVIKIYGGGSYKLRTFRANGQMYKQVTFEVDPRIKGNLGETTVMPSAPGTDRTTEMLLKMIDPAGKSGGQDTIEMMKLMMNQGQQAAMLQMQMMQQAHERSLQMMVGFMGALKPAQSGSAVDSWMPLMLKMMESKGGGGPSQDIGSLVDTMLKLKGLTDGTQKESEEPDMMTKLMMGLAPVAMSLLGGRGAVPQAAPAQPNGGPELPSPQSSQQDMIINMFIGRLVSAARKGSDVEAYAILIVDTLSETQLDDLCSKLSQPDWFEQLFKGNPDMASLRPWFEKLKETLLTEPAEDPVVVDPATAA